MGVKILWPLLFVGSIIFSCLLIFPSDPRLADLFGRAGKYDEGIEKYQTLLKHHPLRISARIQLSKLYILNEEPQKAVRAIEKGGLDSIDDAFFLMQISDIYSQLGDKQKTVFTLEKIVKLDPDNLVYSRKLADAYDWNQETEKARELYEALLVHTRRIATRSCSRCSSRGGRRTGSWDGRGRMWASCQRRSSGPFAT